MRREWEDFIYIVINEDLTQPDGQAYIDNDAYSGRPVEVKANHR
jgi:hypothetical protein